MHLIAGPCALESREQWVQSLRICSEWGIATVRASLWKPRTKEGWEGLGEEGISFFLEESFARRIRPATEVALESHVLALRRELRHYSSSHQLFLWIGARNQNHWIQQAIARALLPIQSQVTLMIKNPPWASVEHWKGICEHILATGFPRERLILCHRGFHCQKGGPWRNAPNFALAMQLRSELALPMYLDPSHIAGSQSALFGVMESAQKHPFDGYFIEMHPNPERARTDAQQQLSPSLFRNFFYQFFSQRELNLS